MSTIKSLEFFNNPKNYYKAPVYSKNKHTFDPAVKTEQDRSGGLPAVRQCSGYRS